MNFVGKAFWLGTWFIFHLLLSDFPNPIRLSNIVCFFFLISHHHLMVTTEC